MSFGGTGIPQTGSLRGRLQRRMGLWELKSGWVVLGGGCLWGWGGACGGGRARPSVLMVLWGRWSPRRLWAGPGSLGGRGGVAGPSAAPCAASAPRGGPAPVAMGTAAAARLARSSPASVSAAPGAGGVGRVRAAAAAATGERPGAGAGPGRERGCRPLGPGPGRGQGEGRGGAGAVAVGEGGVPRTQEQRERGGGTGSRPPPRSPGRAFAPVVRGPAGSGFPLLALSVPTCAHARSWVPAGQAWA